MFTLAQLEEAVTNEDNGFYGSWEELTYCRRNEAFAVNGKGYSVEVLEEFTAGEGYDGNSTYIIFSLDGRTFKKTGMYRSHYGNDWDGPLIEVEAVEKTVTAWEEKTVGVYGNFSVGDLADAYSDRAGAVGGWGEWGRSCQTLEINGNTYVTEPVKQIGGGEGSGEYTAVLFKIGERLFRKEGYYASHYGSEFDGELEEVESYEKTVTDYRPVKS